MSFRTFRDAVEAKRPRAGFHAIDGLYREGVTTAEAIKRLAPKRRAKVAPEFGGDFDYSMNA